jgi:hypothetical protein
MAFVRDKEGNKQEVKLSPTIYREAVAQNKTVPQLINSKYPTDVEKYGTAWDQLCASSGLIIAADRSFGLRPPTIGDILEGKAEFGAATTADADPVSRNLYPAAVLEVIDATLLANKEIDPNAFDQMVAIDTTVTSPRTEQPQVDVSEADNTRARAIAQLAEPETMIQITTSEVSRNLPTLSLGLEVSDQALQATTLDFVAKVVTRTTQVEKNARVYDYLLGFLQGDADVGQGALSQTKANVFDSSITNAGEITKKALVKWLFNNYYKRQITHLVTDVDGLLAIESAMSTTNTGNFPLPGLAPQFSIMNRVLENLRVFVVDPNMNWPANTIMGLDSRWAIARIRNSAAQYSAVEQFVLRRSSALRFDFAEIAYRLFDDAFDVVSLTI